MKNNVVIKVENLSKVYPLRQVQLDENANTLHEHWALKDVSFEIKRGESVGIIGPNGSGKSTLLKILAGVTKPTFGSVEVRGKIASILDIGAGFHLELSGRENIFLNGQIHGFSKKEIENKFDKIVEFSGIEKFIDEPVKNYSNGMYLRLAFSIMTQLDFDVYLFDEAFSVGDIGFTMKSREKINQLSLQDKTVILVSHNVQEILEQDFFIQLEKGKLLNASYQKEVLIQYSEKNIINNDQVINSTNVSITDFSKYKVSKEIKLLKVDLLQEKVDEFASDKPFKLIVEFEQLRQDDEFNLFVTISDAQGAPYLTTSPLLSGIRNRGIKNHSYFCEIPASIFGTQVYSINLIISKSLPELKQNGDISLSKNDLENLKRNLLKINNLILFKTKFILDKSIVDLVEFNTGVGLLSKLKWGIS